MPVCPTCDNRPFATKEALLQHVRTSSNAHPFCLACDRRFASELAYNAHMAAKHPPTFDCLKCGKSYASQFALEGHYRGHTDHPNCPVCGKGFYDFAQLSAHIHEIHNNLWCNTCNMRFESTIVAEEHYRTSPAHPKCQICAMGCRDEGILQKHMRSHESTGTSQNALSPVPNGSGGPEPPTLRSPTRAPSTQSYQPSPPTPSSITSLPPPSTPSQPKEVSSIQHNTMHGLISPPHPGFVRLSAPMTHNGSTASFGGTGFSPLSPKPNIFNKELRRVTSIDTTPRVGSPDISQILNPQASPLLNVEAPAFSPIALPKPGRQVDEIWSSRENIQIGRTALPSSSVPASTAPQPWNSTSKVASNGSSISKSVPTTQVIPFVHPYRFQAPPPRHRASSDFGDSKNSPSSFDSSKYNSPTISEPTRLNSATHGEYHFNPRLYPGSARYAATQFSQSVGYPNGTSGASVTVPASLVSLPLPFSLPQRQTSAVQIKSPPSEKKKGQLSESDDLYVDAVVNKHKKKAFEDSIAVVSPMTTPRLGTETPLHDFGVKPEIGTHANAQSSPSDFSTDFSTISSASSGRERTVSPTPVGIRRQRNRSRSRTSTARSDISSLNIPTYEVVDCSQQASPFSPEVTSPAGLAPLPAISPLGPSPIDLDASFEIPEARHPLPDSNPPSPPIAEESLDYQGLQIFRPKPVERPNSRISGDFGLHRASDDEGILFSSAEGIFENDFGECSRPPSSAPSSPRSFVTSHQEPEESEHQEDLARFGGSRSSSRARGSSSETISDVFYKAEPNVVIKSPSPTPSPTPVTPKAEDDIVTLPSLEAVTTDNLDATFNNKQHHSQTLVAPSLGVTPNLSINSTAASEGIGSAGSSSSLPSLQCRACRRETPDDITATMCGHVFCNRCIVDAVIKTSRCPFCSTPTLLYCLFRLDLTT
ncbi:hypothetical protein Agabi119p4_9438 [Agaricus bisporus var. burnettii]|uniref:RING-type domain-containing protein n=1 Tax=Agaricus bisporus var. burnettii TaxID=192524 RepID=A0A8H7C326_AGABI|nr:hypothetical protein Agabi119p4_9438 [Agaricus bisporus var. burnettii]